MSVSRAPGTPCGSVFGRFRVSLMPLVWPGGMRVAIEYSAYGPVWVGHNEILYALQVPFDVYMPLLASIFHFPAIVFHYFHGFPWT